MTKQLYQWHRRLSIIIAIPVLLWASSGFMHPLMTNIRPAIATQGWSLPIIDSGRLSFPLPEALHKHHLDSFAAVRLVHIDTNWFYQVQPAARRAGAANNPASAPVSPAIQPAVPVYLSCRNGNVLAAGDWLYAQYLARHFLEGDGTTPAVTPATASPAAPRPIVVPAAYTETAPDCCGAATECVLHPARGAKVANVSLLTSYDKEYKSINRLLPVYRVSFERPDGIRIYVETTQDRFSFAMDNKRAVFDEIFRLFHTWGWLDVLGKGRLVVEMGFALLAFCTAVLGIWLFFTTRSAKAKDNGLVRARRNHRYTAIVAALFTLMWSFSGAYHAFVKLTGETDPEPAVRQGNFAAGEAAIDHARLRTAASRPITNISPVKINGQLYWRTTLAAEHSLGRKDLMKDGKATASPVLYIKNSDYSVLPEGDQQYACSLAACYSGQPAQTALSTTPVTAFNDEYNFTDKRLPVWRVGYPGAGHPRYYVETSSGQLAAFVNDAVWREGYSFSVFHKHHFMDWGGKTIRDGSTLFWAFAQVVMVTIGLVLWIQKNRR
jgi:hypothetical protein